MDEVAVERAVGVDPRDVLVLHAQHTDEGTRDDGLPIRLHDSGVDEAICDVGAHDRQIERIDIPRRGGRRGRETEPRKTRYQQSASAPRVGQAVG